MLSKIHIMKRLHTTLSLAEQAKIELHFIEYCAIHNIDVSTYSSNKRTIRAFVDHLAHWYSDFEGITDWDAAYKTNFFKSLSLKVGNMTGTRCKVIRGKVAVRKNELDKQESSSDESEEIEEKQAKANPKREAKASNPSPTKSPKVEAKTEADLANLN